ncbi:sporulation integral membrane protein YlbJ [Herbivorax sp. ANBcel31]|uniref:sporulation integral membrane protein YlbJ n=1 Tax=Herbivorax sp. ANBcel31 TaxID=3069754 RepID=UPI0027B0505C|nr:sporulation integral membrane protein YlbJ [Herbivorax sp. ANBcel31]MDQ2087640.1 sporulation integral membrane protein YlbJ [Herbivorax sp. ANBcel31]
MNLLTLLMITIIIVAFFTRKTPYIIYLKSFLLPTICIAFIMLLIVFSNTAVESAQKGLNLWLKVVLPSLFPFFVASDILNKTGFIKTMGILLEPVMRPLFNVPGCGSFALAMGLTSGYPVGAKLASSMRKENLLTKVESERLLAFTNNSGPLFITGAVAVGMFKMPGLGVLLLGCHMLASITVGLLFRFYKKNSKSEKTIYHKDLIQKLTIDIKQSVNNTKFNLGKVLGDAIKNALEIMLTVGGFIILFSVIIDILTKTGFILSLSNIVFTFLNSTSINKEIITALLSGFFEITTGADLASRANTSFIQKLISVSIIMGWAGLSVHSQVYSIVSKTDISIKPYLLGKFLQGIFAAIYIFLAIKITGLYSTYSQPAFSTINSTSLSWYKYLHVSCYNLLMSIFIVILTAFIILFFTTLKNKMLSSN